ncbi:hypothetical protein [Motilimonas sp. KMU-193]|uniref:hypothetical protein n=1 Tax=Motilimonas sp. KMU-193 TaxID=3388668 RepID=UPI00396B04DC
MPMLIDYIEDIAVAKQRDVVWISFIKPDMWSERVDFDYQNSPIRSQIMNWLTANEYHYYECGDYECLNLSLPYRGSLYIDIAMDQTDPAYNKLLAYLEYPDGICRFEGVYFMYIPLDKAQERVEKKRAFQAELYEGWEDD